MLKGFLTITSAVVLVAVTPDLQAQVYRCETASGVMFSDFPCGDSAEEIELEVLQPASQGIGAGVTPVSEGAPEDASGVLGDALPEDGQTLDEVLQVLNGQRAAQIGQLDKTLAELRRQVESADIDGPAKAELMMRIAQIESSRETILDEFDARTAEAESQAQ